MKGLGTRLLNELQKRVQGKEIYLFTDSACTYQFYEKRGFQRQKEKRFH
ncbi:GNAT family N-acetyltransferase [Enterococcus gallinarum]|nr:GNAT family N-acetyltransferase [Enterococcus gallinarum]